MQALRYLNLNRTIGMQGSKNKMLTMSIKYFVSLKWYAALHYSM